MFFIEYHFLYCKLSYVGIREALWKLCTRLCLGCSSPFFYLWCLQKIHVYIVMVILTIVAPSKD